MASLAALVSVLLRHTSTPDSGVAGLWEGRGGLLGFFGDLPSRGFYTVGDDDPNHRAMLARSLRDPFNNVFRKPTWQEGILSREISGARDSNSRTARTCCSTHRRVRSPTPSGSSMPRGAIGRRRRTVRPHRRRARVSSGPTTTRG